MSINPHESIFFEIQTIDDQYHVISSSGSDLGRVEYIPLTKESSQLFPASWKKVELVVDGMRSWGFVNMSSHKLLSLKEKLDPFLEDDAKELMPQILEETQKIPPHLRIELTTELLIAYQSYISSYPREFSTNFELCLSLMRKQPNLLRFFSKSLQSNKEILLEAVKKDQSMIMCIDEKMLRDPDFMPYLNYPALLIGLTDCQKALYHIDESIENLSNSESELSYYLRSLTNFSGLPSAYYQDTSLENVSVYTATREIAKSLTSPIEGFFADDQAELKEAFEIASNSDFLNSHTVERIQSGKFVVLPLGLIEHSVSIIFSGTHFAICNRGFGNETGIIKYYEYDPSIMSLEIIAYLVANYSYIYPDLTKACEHLNSYLYQNLPLLLHARELIDRKSGTRISLPFKNQTIGNCAKASQLVALKTGIFLRFLERGYDEKSAARHAKQLGKVVSFSLREKSIEDSLLALETSKKRALLSEKDEQEAFYLIEYAKKKLLFSRLFDML
ncbi:MAG: DUF4116 domain-containing protein [Chlamydiae bacterium]|nr:DUF4116 domain-containing protein [Chlamydiota bacterium]